VGLLAWSAFLFVAAIAIFLVLDYFIFHIPLSTR
jgi:hypothetical protein